MISFKKPDFKFKFPLIPGSSNNHAEWEFDGKAQDIVMYKPECTCTADISIIGNKITAKFKEDMVGADLSKINKNSKEYQDGKIKFSKSIIVYLNDGKDLYIVSGTSKLFNPDKERRILTLSGEVDFNDLKEFLEKSVHKIKNKKIINP